MTNANEIILKKMEPYAPLIDELNQFLLSETPMQWIQVACKTENLSLLLIDHMICELKAAQTAAWLLRKYAVDENSAKVILDWLVPYEHFIYKKEGSLESLTQSSISKKLTLKNNQAINKELIDKMVMLIREELHHFYQVLSIMNKRKIEYHNITAGRYAKGLMQTVRTHEPATLIDKLICGAYIEARSCERFAKLAPYVDVELADFFISLLRSEARHYQDYLTLAQLVANDSIQDRVQLIGQVESQLIQTSDSEFRFHSGLPNFH